MRKSLNTLDEFQQHTNHQPFFQLDTSSTKINFVILAFR